MLNLLSNGSNLPKLTDKSRSIPLSTAVGTWSFRSQTRGIGIPPEHLQRVLNPFEQVADHLTKENEGSGLGLPIARALMELHGGELVLTSTLGMGTTVFLRLPNNRVHCLVPKLSDERYDI